MIARLAEGRLFLCVITAWDLMLSLQGAVPRASLVDYQNANVEVMKSAYIVWAAHLFLDKSLKTYMC